MKNIFNALKLPSIIALMIISFIACDKDFSNIDSDVLGKDNANFITDFETLPIVAYNKKLEALQINGLASNLLGVFNDPAYGKTTTSMITQVSPGTFSPDFNDNPVIDSVVLKIPYYSSLTGELDDNDNAEYSIDSLYGNSPIKLSIYQNNYFLRDFDPNTGLDGTQLYYSKADGTINNTDNFALNGTSPINFDDFKGELIYEANNFTPESDNVYLYTYSDEDSDDDGQLDVENIEVEAPSLRIKFVNTDFWKDLILDKQDDIVLSNSNNFNNYFRGLYFKTEAINDSGSMVLLNTASTDAGITIYYTYDVTTTSDDGTSTTTQSQSTYSLSFSGNILNTSINDFNLVNLENGDETLGDKTLYLKGVEGSMAVIDLFEKDGALKDFLDTYRVPNGLDGYEVDDNGNYILQRLINDVQLIIHEDDVMQTFPEDDNGNDYSTFDRIYAYDFENNQITIDYLNDPLANTTDALNSSIISLGQRIKDDEGDAKYKIRLTEHFNNILLNDSTNTKIGLVLSTNVNYTNNANVLNNINDLDDIPAASLITPRGTILHGSNIPVGNQDEERKMRLEIYFTEQNN